MRAEQCRPGSKCLKVLMAEDREPDAELAAALLRRSGLRLCLDRVASREAFLEKLDDFHYDVVLADYRLPGWEGIEALSLLRERGLDVPVLLLTGTLSDEEAIAFIRAGIADYVLKDHIGRLPLAVERALLEHRQRRRMAGVMQQLAERVKELTGLHETARTLFYEDISDPRQWLERIAVILPRAFQYPDVAAARAAYGQLEAASPGFRPTARRLAANFTTSDDTAGCVEVVYLEERSPEAEGPFLTEERQCLTLVADLLRSRLERRRAEQALREGEERYRDLFENANDLLFTCDMLGAITGVNQAVEQATGFSRGELIGLNVIRLAAPDQVEHVARHLVLDQMELRGFEVDILSRDGRRLSLDVSARRIVRNAEVVGFQGIARDITERRKLEAQLSQAQKMEAIGRLAGGVAHDFNNVLTVIDGYAGMLIEETSEGHPHRRPAEAIRQAAQRAVTLTSQLLAFSRKQVVQPRLLDLNIVVRNIEPILRRLIGEDIELVVGLADGLGAVLADPGQIDQVLMNLAVNARDAMPAGGRLQIETSEATALHGNDLPPGRYVALAVRDTGSGMDRATMTHIFEPFFTTKERGRGTGLGLATVYGVVQQSGGYITVASEPYCGSEFRIFLPWQARDEAIEEQARPMPQNQAACETVLLVEDDDAVRELVHETLARAGYTVLEAADGEQALEMAQHHPGAIDLLLSDVVMPRLSGPQVAERLAAVRPRTRVLLMSGYTDDEVLRRGVQQAQIAFLQKPFTPSALEQRIRQVLEEAA